MFKGEIMKILNIICWIITVVLLFLFFILDLTVLAVLIVIASFLSLIITSLYLSKRLKTNKKISAYNKSKYDKTFRQNTPDNNKEYSIKNSVSKNNHVELFISQTFGGYDYCAVIYTVNTKQFYNALYLGRCVGGGVSYSQHDKGEPISFEQVRTLAAESSDCRAKTYLSISEENWQDIIEDNNSADNDLSAVKNNKAMQNNVKSYNSENNYTFELNGPTSDGQLQSISEKETINNIIIRLKGSETETNLIIGNVLIKDNKPYIIFDNRIELTNWESVKIMALEQSKSTYLWINRINESNWHNYIHKEISDNQNECFIKIYNFPKHATKQRESFYYDELVFDCKTEKLYICHSVAYGTTGHGFAGNPDFIKSYIEVSMNEICEIITGKDKLEIQNRICKSFYAHKILKFIFKPIRSDIEKQRKLKENWQKTVLEKNPSFSSNTSNVMPGLIFAKYPINLKANCAFVTDFIPSEHYVDINIDLLTGQPYYSCCWIAGMGPGMNNYLTNYYQYPISWDDFLQCTQKSSYEAYKFFKDINSENWKDFINSDWISLTLYGSNSK